MNIDLLKSKGATPKSYNQGDYIFHEGDTARFYYQVEVGRVKMFNLNEEGREYIQGFFKDGESFGEPPMFIGEKYPASAMACKKTTIFCLPKDKILQIIHEDPTFRIDCLNTLARRVYDKAKSSREIANNTPCHRILALLEGYKRKYSLENNKVHIPYTRQEIANMLGLRVETVIRTLSRLKENKRVEIIERKLYY